MPRGEKSKSIASVILLELEDESDEEGTFLVFYDFRKKPSQYFYKNVHRIFETLEDGAFIQASTIECKRLKTARAIEKLAKRYEADVLLYRAEPLE
ncbi:hypothetical protein ES703_108117 [subsurface metagenome]